MAHYGDPVIPWWNQHFHEVYEEGTLERLCEEAKTKYGKATFYHSRNRSKYSMQPIPKDYIKIGIQWVEENGCLSLIER